MDNTALLIFGKEIILGYLECEPLVHIFEIGYLGALTDNQEVEPRIGL